jgi:hypothetical protein
MTSHSNLPARHVSSLPLVQRVSAIRHRLSVSDGELAHLALFVTVSLRHVSLDTRVHSTDRVYFLKPGIGPRVFYLAGTREILDLPIPNKVLYPFKSYCSCRDSGLPESAGPRLAHPSSP